MKIIFWFMYWSQHLFDINGFVVVSFLLLLFIHLAIFLCCFHLRNMKILLDYDAKLTAIFLIVSKTVRVTLRSSFTMTKKMKTWIVIIIIVVVMSHAILKPDDGSSPPVIRIQIHAHLMCSSQYHSQRKWSNNWISGSNATKKISICLTFSSLCVIFSSLFLWWKKRIQFDFWKAAEYTND